MVILGSQRHFPTPKFLKYPRREAALQTQHFFREKQNRFVHIDVTVVLLEGKTTYNAIDLMTSCEKNWKLVPDQVMNLGCVSENTYVTNCHA